MPFYNASLTYCIIYGSASTDSSNSAPRVFVFSSPKPYVSSSGDSFMHLHNMARFKIILTDNLILFPVYFIKFFCFQSCQYAPFHISDKFLSAYTPPLSALRAKRGGAYVIHFLLASSCHAFMGSTLPTLPAPSDSWLRLQAPSPEGLRPSYPPHPSWHLSPDPPESG